MSPNRVSGSLLACVGTAAVVAAVVSVLLAPARSSQAPEAGRTAGLLDAIDGVRAELDAMRARLDRLESAPVPIDATPAPAPPIARCDPHCESLRVEIDRLGRRIEALVEHLPHPSPGLFPGFQVGSKRPWGAEQATGEPDTPLPGDRPTAWASQTPDEQGEWLLLEFPVAVLPSGVHVHETFNPGALSQVSIFDAEGKEHFVWGGADQTSPGSEWGVSWIPFTAEFKTRKVKLFFHSPGVPGWNEVDAVALADAAGKTQWASAATASSVYQSGGVFLR